MKNGFDLCNKAFAYRMVQSETVLRDYVKINEELYEEENKFMLMHKYLYNY